MVLRGGRVDAEEAVKRPQPRHRRVGSARITPPPPGWTLQADIAEELLALSELTLMRKLGTGGDA